LNFSWLVQATKPILSSLDVVNPITETCLSGLGVYFFIFGDKGMNGGTFKRMQDVVVACIIR
jgi:hypothetical protein